MRWLLAVVATLAFAPSAYAQGANVQWVADTEPWSPAEVTIKAGESVTWTWSSGTHNVDATSANWNVTSGTTSPFTHAFAAAGTYDYVCQFHSAMTGRVIVTDDSGNPPPPPPPGDQHWANDQPPPSVFETGGGPGDRTRPRLSRVRVTSVGDGARVRFRLSERAQVVVRFKLAGLTVKTARRSFRAGMRSLTVRDRRMEGRYRVEVVASDRWGNRSQVKHTRVTIP